MVIDYLFFQAFLPYAASNYFVHFLGDGEGLVDEAVGQLLHLSLLHCEHEIVSPVVSQRERAIILAEDGGVAGRRGQVAEGQQVIPLKKNYRKSYPQAHSFRTQ